MLGVNPILASDFFIFIFVPEVSMRIHDLVFLPCSSVSYWVSECRQAPGINDENWRLCWERGGRCTTRRKSRRKSRPPCQEGWWATGPRNPRSSLSQSPTKMHAEWRETARHSRQPRKSRWRSKRESSRRWKRASKSSARATKSSLF